MTRTVVVLATLDTKSEEAEYLRSQIESHGAKVTLIDLGVLGEPQTISNVSRQEVAAAAGRRR